MADRIDTQIAGYRIESLISRGGMGEVYLAEQDAPRRKVALKLLSPELSLDAGFRERFARESEAAASIDHPNVIPIHQSGQVDGTLFIAMRYVEGTDLATLLAEQGPLPLERAVHICAQVAEALEAAHERGLIHRDVKPANILIGRSDHAYLSDFGLFRRTEVSSGITKTGQFMGTLDYASPEQFEGKSLGPPTDVYSLGCVLYECLVGEPPFRREQDAAVMYAHLHDPPPSARSRQPELPPWVDQVVEQAMAKRPVDRFATAGELATALKGAKESQGHLGADRRHPRRSRGHRPGRAAPPFAPPPSETRRRGRRAALVAGGLALLLIAVGIPLVLGVTGVDPVTVLADSVTSMDTSGVIRGSTPLRARPGAIAAGAGAVWVASPDEGRVSRVDPDSGAVTDSIPVGEDPTAIAVGEGSVWVANAAGPGVSRISPQTNDVVDEIETCAGPNAIAVGLGAVWVTCGFDTVALRIDPSSGTREEIPLPGSPSGVAVGVGAVWMSIAASSTVVQVDPSTLAVVDEIEVGNGPEALVTASRSIWVANRLDGTVDRLDPSTGTRRATIDVGRDPSALAASGGDVWVAMAFDGQVLSIDATTNKIDQEIALGATASSVAVGGDRIWASAGAAAGDHRGGTLRTSLPFVDTLDPGFNYSIWWQIISLTNDGLVGYRRVGGIGGTNLVPNLALSRPQPTDNGTTYRFQLRPGIRYSTGETVEPEDVRFALERVLGSTSPGKQFYGAIEGAERCSVGACDLSEGIVVDAAHNTVTFHLSRPDPDFLYKLSMPFAFPLPSTTPMKDQRLNPVPATGPYVVTASDRRTVELDRNPEFRPWNSPARPEGFPDRIIVKVIDDSEAAVSRVLDGSLDWTLSQPSPETIGRLLTERPGQMHPTPAMANWQMYLNTARPPFDDDRVRQAVNYAVDRDRIAAIFGVSGNSTCQILFPNSAAYEPYCPFTLDPGPTWNGPDLERARDLIEEAGAAGIAVEVSGWTGLPAPTRRLVRYLVGVLDVVGLRARADLTKDSGDYFERVNQGETQMALLGFFPEWLAPEGVLSSQFACSGSNNLSFFCDPEIDDAMDRASAMQLEDLAAAADAWAALEHRLVDDALILPLVVRLPTGLVSARTGNYQLHPMWDVLLDQLWVV